MCNIVFVDRCSEGEYTATLSMALRGHIGMHGRSALTKKQHSTCAVVGSLSNPLGTNLGIYSATCAIPQKTFVQTCACVCA